MQIMPLTATISKVEVAPSSLSWSFEESDGAATGAGTGPGTGGGLITGDGMGGNVGGITGGDGGRVGGSGTLMRSCSTAA